MSFGSILKEAYMVQDFEIIKNVCSGIIDNYESIDLLQGRQGCRLPDRGAIIRLLKEIRKIMFPGYYLDTEMIGRRPEDYTEERLYNTHRLMAEQISLAITYADQGDCGCGGSDPVVTDSCVEKARRIADEFLEELPNIQNHLLKDVDAAYDGDPAAQDKESIIFSYPGLYAIFVYRVAHELYIRNVPFIPRIMTEFAHSRTGIDINSGATIGEYFFIDHGTGVVIGETTIIGDHVKLYQGVTLGALSTRKGQALRGVKRHPTIEDNVTIYANSIILGGETVIGHDSVISGNTFIIDSVPAGTRATADMPAVRLMPQYEVPYYGDNI